MPRDVMRNRMVGNRMVRGLNGLVRVRDRRRSHVRRLVPGLSCHGRRRRHRGVHDRVRRRSRSGNGPDQHADERARDEGENEGRPTVTPVRRPMMATHRYS